MWRFAFSKNHDENHFKSREITTKNCDEKYFFQIFVFVAIFHCDFSQFNTIFVTILWKCELLRFCQDVKKTKILSDWAMSFFSWHDLLDLATTPHLSELDIDAALQQFFIRPGAACDRLCPYWTNEITYGALFFTFFFWSVVEFEPLISVLRDSDLLIVVKVNFKFSHKKAWSTQWATVLLKKKNGNVLPVRYRYFLR